MPWPYKAVPLAIGAGLALEWAPIPRRWPAALGRGAIRAGLVLLAQSPAMMVYAGFTARGHDLPWPLAWLVGLIASTSGLDAAVDQSTVAIYSMPEIHRFAATWELLVDPVSVCFLAGGLVILGLSPVGNALRGVPGPASERVFPPRNATEGVPYSLKAWTRRAGVLALVLVLWLPVRTGLLLTLYMHRVLRGDAATAMNQFFNPWVHLLLAAGPVLLAWWFVRLPAAAQDESVGNALRGVPGVEENPSRPLASERHAARSLERSSSTHSDAGPRKRTAAAAVLVLEAVALLTFGILWDPAGVRKGGRVMVVERHSAWEPTSPHYDTTRYGEDASYTYAAIYDYVAHYYQMSRLSESANIDDESLSQCDVLVIKTPTEPYRSDEAAAVARFVGRGGGLLMIGDHTNCDRSGAHLNAVARPFGFQFRYDILFPVGSPYVEWIEPPSIPHPILQDVGPFRFAGTCSLDPGASLGRAVVLTTGKWSLPPDYHTENYFPQAEYRPDMRVRRLHPALVHPLRPRTRAGHRRLDPLLQLLHVRAGQVGVDAGHARMAQPPQRLRLRGREAGVLARARPGGPGRAGAGRQAPWVRPKNNFRGSVVGCHGDACVAMRQRHHAHASVGMAPKRVPGSCFSSAP